MMAPALSPAVFLDRDGTLMREVEYCRDPALVELLPGVEEGLTRLRAAGFCLVIITNQSGIGRGWITLEEYQAVQARLLELLPSGIITQTYFCADHPDQPSARRKPAAGMLQEAAQDLALDLQRSYLIGDKRSDMQCAQAAGARGILVQTGYGSEENPTEAIFTAPDFATVVALLLEHATKAQGEAAPATSSGFSAAKG